MKWSLKRHLLPSETLNNKKMDEKGYIHFLKAGYGDAFILHCRKGDNKGIVVVDGGQSSNRRFNQFVSEVENLGHIDLMVLTHPDDDHLVGIKKYIESHLNDEVFPVSEIWANCAPNIEVNISNDVSPLKAKRLSEILGKLESEGKTKWRCDVSAIESIDLQFADIYVIGPSKDVLKAFIERYREKTGYYDSEEGTDVSAAIDNSDFTIRMENLAQRQKRTVDLLLDMRQFLLKPNVRHRVDFDGIDKEISDTKESQQLSD